MKNNQLLINHYFSNNGTLTILKSFFLILSGSLLLAVSSKVQVPFWPVPMTMQTFIVFLIGMTYGLKLSFLTLLAYILEGAFGLPVFASGSGLAYLMGPTAGYIYGMFFAGCVIGYLAEKGFSNSYFLSFLSLIFLSIIIFLLGVVYLGTIIGFDKALAAGLLPFIPSEFFKIALAVAIIPSVCKYTNKNN